MNWGYALFDCTMPGSYFSVHPNGNTVNQHNWSQEKAEALCFARYADAEDFANKYLANQMWQVKRIEVDAD